VDGMKCGGPWKQAGVAPSGTVERCGVMRSSGVEPCGPVMWRCGACDGAIFWFFVAALVYLGLMGMGQ
jgi:hypothetical protein